jgi:3-dehydroquinate dehydratase / shikimate dehydrogenase
VNPFDIGNYAAAPFDEPLCVVIGRTRHKMVQVEVQEAARQGARLIELRLDFLKKAPDFKRLLDNKPCPMVATVRRPADGGRWDGTEEARLTLLRQAIVSGFDWADIETDAADKVRRFGPVRRIISYHNLRECPADLEKIHERMCEQDADIVKIAVRVTKPEENMRLLSLLRFPPRPTVAFGMGDIGFPSRILGAKYATPFAYAAFNKERGIAPGMPSYQEMKQVYHYDRIDPDTQVFGVVGDPVAHSLGPVIHNAAFRKLGLNAVYLPFRVPRGDLPAFVKALNKVPVQGYSVTIPHKEAAVALLGVLPDPTAQRTGAANTLVKTREGFAAYNTDYGGILDALRDYWSNPPEALVATAPVAHAEGPDRPFASKTVLILGAGGVARAAAYALQAEGALVTITNRNADRAQGLAHELGCRHVDWAARHTVLCDVVINCTPVGMHPDVDESPLHHGVLKPGLTVFDTVYTPENTLLVKEARARGCHVVTGVDLFVRQAALQFKLFTGKEGPMDLFRKIVKRALSPVTIKEE